ncbi:hypothetical protein F5146DRAFT_1001456 [Armillaria mellea]|nr:hypothetical protein F5146DRAFT_1001456 [Armillaria mellea]
MSACMDANAPQWLSLEAIDELLAEEELVTMRETCTKLAKEVTTLLKNVKSAEDDEDSQILVASQIADLKMQLDQHDREYCNIVAREKQVHVKKAREDYFAGASACQLKDVDLGKKKSSIQGKENCPPLGVSPSLSKLSVNNFIATFFNVATTFDTVNDSIIVYIKAVTTLPSKHLSICYPNKSPDVNNKCPICRTLCSPSAMPKGIGRHLHKHLADCMHVDAQQRAQDNFDHTTCAWDGCSTQVYKLHSAFITHMQTHLASLTKLLLHGNQTCKWLKDGKLYAEEGDGSWIVPDWANHFTTEHCLNVNATITIDYCSICGQWFEDDIGDGASWTSHCVGHYDDMFSPFQKWQDGLVDLQPTGIVDIGGAISYDLCDLLHGALLHGYIKSGIALQSYFCPFCVFNAHLPITRRMMQYLDILTFQWHISQQHLLDSDTTLCPVPSCGESKLSLYELATHLILFHCLPVVACQGYHKLFHHLSDNGKKIGPYSFELPTDTSLASMSTKRDHCSSKKFKIKEPKKHCHGRNGDEYVFAEWILTAPPLL